MGAHLRARPVRRPRDHAGHLPRPRAAGTWAISAGNHFVAYADGFVADSGAWFARRPAFWFRAIPGHDRVALRRVQEAVRFVRVPTGATPCPQEC